MNKEEMLKEIYEKISDKTLSFGCKIKHPYKDEIAYISKGYWYSNNGGDRIPFLEHDEFARFSWCHCNKDDIKEIIGHPVMIGDVLDWIQDNTPDNEERNLIFNYWKLLTKPIDEQNIECIEYIYNLIKNNNE